jgi:hypothetical protein
MRDKTQPYDSNDYRARQLRSNPNDLSSSSSAQSQPKCTISTEPKTYYCQRLGHNISGVAARNCNYSNLENYTCNPTGEPCVAKEGLEQFAQSLPKCTKGIGSFIKRLLAECRRELNKPLPKDIDPILRHRSPFG